MTSEVFQELTEVVKKADEIKYAIEVSESHLETIKEHMKKDDIVSLAGDKQFAFIFKVCLGFDETDYNINEDMVAILSSIQLVLEARIARLKKEFEEISNYVKVEEDKPDDDI